MAITFNETALSLISDSLSLLGVVAAGEIVTTNDNTFCLQQLNSMVKAWMGQGIHLWTEESGTIFLSKGQGEYDLSAGSTTKCSDGTSTVETTLSAAAAASAGSITVTSTTNLVNNQTMANADNIGIVLDDGSTFWTTINGTPTATSVTLTAGPTTGASIGNSVFSYTTQMARPLNIRTARYRLNGFDRQMEIKARQDYMNIPQKGLTGSPIILYYSPQLSSGQTLIWPTPDNANGTIECTWTRTIKDFTTTADNPDLPQEWLEAIKYNLAVRLAPAYGINLSSGGISGNPDILRQATQYLEDMKAWDSEEPFVQIVPKGRY